MNAIEVVRISKAYGRVQALLNVSFHVGQGELFGLIGPDGAGKTSLFRILATLIAPQYGTARVGGYDIYDQYKEIRRIVGYMPGKFSLYPDLSVEENLRFFASLFGVTLEQNYEVVAPIYKQIEPFSTRKAGKLSGGMKQKLALSCALIHKPQILFLDEPTTGVDALSRAEFWDMLSLLKTQGLSILVSTPYMDEASRCDRIALMSSGKILCIDTPAHMVATHRAPLYALSGPNRYALLQAARNHPQVTSCYAFGEAHHLTVTEQFNPQHFVDSLGSEVVLKRVDPTVEDVFIQLMSYVS